MRSLLLDKLWYGEHPLRWVLLPFACLYQLISCFRRWVLEQFFQKKPPVPIIVVGNLTVGGVGKTPLVMAIAKRLQGSGLRVGIVSRGYGARVRHFPHEVHPNDSALDVGDEPLLLAQNLNCPVVIAPHRTQAVSYLVQKHQTQVIISDDGLQHYKMGRSIEIAVIDGLRGLGNGFCLPAGPLREGAHRLKQVDFVVVNGAEWPSAYRMDLQPGQLTQLVSHAIIEPYQLSQPIAAIAAIGNPKRFFDTLKTLGLSFSAYPFPDHHAFSANELNALAPVLVMTEKDAVKCRAFATSSMYYLPVQARISDEFWDKLWSHKHLEGCF
jgi:tetraacyldisaccharide 4'-kinase